MQTQCPHCKTRFRVTETQINIADGLVRCGVCTEVFNAFEVVDQYELQPSLLSEDSVTGPDTGSDAERPVPLESQSADHGYVANNSEIETGNQTHEFAETAVTAVPEKDGFNFFDENSNESLDYVVPDRFRGSRKAQSHSLLTTLLWSAGILLLTTTLLIEYVWFNRNQYTHIPELQALIEQLCQRVECKDLTMRDPAKIELVARNVYSHPNEKNALMLNVTIRNNAKFAQPYPVLQVAFSDVRGGTVAARRFLPDEYLPAESQRSDAAQPRMLQPDTSSSITMEIQDPGKQAMTYEFNFL